MYTESSVTYMNSDFFFYDHKFSTKTLREILFKLKVMQVAHSDREKLIMT